MHMNAEWKRPGSREHTEQRAVSAICARRKPKSAAVIVAWRDAVFFCLQHKQSSGTRCLPGVGAIISYDELRWSWSVQSTPLYCWSLLRHYCPCCCCRPPALRQRRLLPFTPISFSHCLNINDEFAANHRYHNTTIAISASDAAMLPPFHCHHGFIIIILLRWYRWKCWCWGAGAEEHELEQMRGHVVKRVMLFMLLSC